MDFEQVNNILREFAHKVVEEAKKKAPTGASNALKDSIDSNTNVSENSFSMDFFMNYYGMAQNFGVQGTHSGTSLKDYKYKKSSNLIGVEYHTGSLAKWAKSKGMQPRGKNGRFGSYKTMGFILANSIKKKGIKPSLFFTKPFEAAFKELPEELIEAFDLDLDTFIDFTLKDIGNE